SHQPVNKALGIDMPDPAAALRRYAEPIYLAALTSHDVELAGEIADGVMPLWWSVERLARSRIWVDRGRAKSGGRGKLEMTLGLPTFVGNDIDRLRDAARANLGFFTALPFFQRL